MSFQLAAYQENAVTDLLKNVRKLLRQSDGKKLVFKAPTGSGKTIMMAEFLAQFADDETHSPCSFIWAAPRQLHEQSKEKLEVYFENSRAMECRYFDDLTDKQIGENEILFFNWESIRQNNNIYIRENENDNNLSNVIANTREAGREIVLIIDESHFHAQAETSQNLVAAIAPKLTIEVSATPVMVNPDAIVPVDIEEIKQEGARGKAMIKKGVVINEDFKNVITRGGNAIKSELANSTDDIVLREALKKREELVKSYKKAGISLNPLLLIQLPDRRGQADEDRQDMIVQTLNDKHGISTDNGKLAIYLAEDKKNLENITRNDSEVEVLIFKQAIALGWDCPRAQVLVLFREWSSPIFSIQTIGRIMRMPYPDDSYYDEDALNYAYVYTNIDDIEIKDDIGRGYVVFHTSTRIPKYEPLKLPSVHSKRHREQTRLTPLFTRLFLDKARSSGLTEKIQTKEQHVHSSFISDWKSENIDLIAGMHLKANTELDAKNDMDLQRLFDYFIRKSLSPEFHPEDRSVGRVKEAVYQFFSKHMKLDRIADFQTIINIVLSDDNRQLFSDAINAAKIAYRADTERFGKELVEEVWEVPEKIVYGEGYAEMEAKKSVLQPFLSDESWKSETKFIEFLNAPRNNVVWFFKNGARDATYFAVPYSDRKEHAPFYVDFVVLMKNGTVALLDPHGIHLADFASKSDGLQTYISDMKKKGRKVIGGIVANTDPRNHTGSWMLYTGKGKDAKEGDWGGWVKLEL
ncbi:DEAD/DEAH box helicase family protein [Patescibacteria group bacterium]|nr:DEAD/DEAH box helicase family protein [Patescibacteria group bacterium]MDE1946462.1 DEAD/DEAH box helicase family protein [Patescibacteria group bacterium]MDE2011069.1 DEAD/DEAH box helicase family protein [Patescibacteria group bacterium]MDE2233731.1 DEAD/DEAH box helicase family protein [Patescibacteria group bacterium]